jgi:poly(A) polymerase
MLRAVRFAAKLGFRLESRTEEALQRMAPLLHEISAARLFDEVVKLFHGGYALASFEALRHYGLFEPLFPMTEEVLEHEEEGFPITFVSNALQNTDVRVAEGKPVTPAFLFAAMLWEPVRERAAALQASGMTDVEALQEASGQILAEQQQYTSIPKRFGIPMREIWTLQPRFTRRRGKTPQRLMGHPRFRAAYDFLCLRARSGEALEEDCDWWTRAQEGGAAERAQAQAQESEGDAPRKRPRRRRRRRRPGGENKGGGSPKS